MNAECENNFLFTFFWRHLGSDRAERRFVAAAVSLLQSASAVVAAIDLEL